MLRFPIYICLIFLFGCTCAVEKDFLSKKTSFSHSSSFIDVVATLKSQVHGESFYFSSDDNCIWNSNMDNELDLIYSLKDEVVWDVVDFILLNDTTYNFIDKDEFRELQYLIENFIISEEKLFLVVNVIIPYRDYYEGEVARYLRYYPTLLSIDLHDDSVLSIHSLSGTYAQYMSHNTNVPSSRFGFTILENNQMVFGNLTFTENKDSIPELLYMDDNGTFRLEPVPFTYYKKKPKGALTITARYFHGEDRSQFCGDYICSSFVNGNPEKPIDSNVSDSTRIIGLSTIMTSDSVYYRSVMNINSRMVELQLMSDDSILIQESVGILNREIISFNFIQSEAWFMLNDTASNGCVLRRYSVSQ